MTACIEFRHLRKCIGNRRLFDIDRFAIPTRTCIVLSGRNGAGKSTLLRILAGLDAPDEAEVVYHDKTLSWKAARNALRGHSVYLHQHPYMFDGSVEDNVGYGLRQSGIGRKAARRQVREALEWAGLTHLARRNARLLSGGEKQRVALTRARILSPDLLLLDEPFSNLDIESRDQAIGLIQRLKSDGISIVITTHEPYIAELLGDEHRHLCKTGPCKYTIVRPFLYQAGATAGYPEPAATRRSTQVSDHHPAAGTIPANDISAVILAGGQARRMGGQDKGLVELDGRPMIEHITAALKPQVGRILINANRNIDRYEEYGFPVVPDMMGNYFGPLVGMASAAQACDTPWLLTVPCDSPFVPQDLAQKLVQAAVSEHADISVAHDGERMQPVFALIRCSLLPSVLDYLENGGRKIDTWYYQHRVALADFSASRDTFLNINTPDERADLERKLLQPRQPVPAV